MVLEVTTNETMKWRSNIINHQTDLAKMIIILNFFYYVASLSSPFLQPPITMLQIFVVVPVVANEEQR